MNPISPIKKSLLLLGISVIIFHTSYAQFEPTGGPEGANFNKIVAINDTLFLTVGSGGILRSVDNGDSWQEVNSGLPINIASSDLKESLGNLYASFNEYGIYKSVNMGDSWTPINNGIENITIYNLGVNGDEIYAANANGGVFYSSDGGGNWIDKSNELASMQVRSFTFQNNTVFAGATKLYKSTNQGDSWQEVPVINLDANGVQSLATFNNVIYLASSQDVVISTDSGTTWDKINPFSFYFIQNIHSSGDTVYMVDFTGTIYSTTDSGSSWSIKNYPVAVPGCIFFDAYTYSNRILLGSTNGLHFSSDNGTTYSTSYLGIAGLTINEMAMDDSYIYATTESNGIFRSNDSGDTWEDISEGLFFPYTAQSVFTVDTLLFTANFRLSKSDDHGNSWTTVYNPSGSNPYIQTVEFKDGLMVMGVNGDGIYISEDTAQTWTKTSTVNLGLDEGYRTIDIKGDSIAVGTENGKIYVTTNKGINWSDVSVANVFYIGDIQFVENRLVASTYGSVIKTDDLGLTWSSFTNGLDGSGFLDIYQYDNTLYLGSDNGIYVLNNSDDSWRQRNSGWTAHNYARCLFSDGSDFYVGTFTKSIWKTSLGYINNTVPEITGISGQLTTDEDVTYTINVSDLIIVDPDVATFDTYTVQVVAGDNYSFNGADVTPAANFNGTLTVPVTVNDGYESSDPFNITITVTPVNDAPVITASVTDLKTFLATPIAIKLSNLEVTDVDNTYPDGFTLTAQTGSNYTVSGATVTPDTGFEGTLTVPVIVNDGTVDSEPFNIPIEVSITAGIENSQLSNNMEVYPVPANNELTIVSKYFSEAKSTIKIADISGKIILQKSFDRNSNTKKTLSISELQKGIYFLVIESQSELGVKRFIKK